MNHYDSLIGRQMELEKNALALGQKAYWAAVDEHKEGQTEELTSPVMSLIRKTVATVAEAVSLKIREGTAKAGRRHAALPLIRDVDPRVLAYHTLRRTMSSISGEQSLTNVALSVGTAILTELQFTAWREHDKGAAKRDEVLQVRYSTAQDNAATKTTAHGKFRAVNHMFLLADIPDKTEWTKTECIHVGSYLIGALVESTGLFRVDEIREHGKSTLILVSSDEVRAWLDDAHSRAALFVPVRLPMLICPVPWTSPKHGGYLTDLGGRQHLIKSRNKAYLSDLAAVHMPAVYDAVNAVQSTAWTINRDVLEIAERCWETGAGVGKAMPVRDPVAMPAAPCAPSELPKLKKEKPDEYRVWARKASIVHADNNRLVSKRKSCVDKLNIARQFVNEAAIYFPHQCDFRGRIYPMPEKLNPQSDDLARGLLRFSEGKPLGARGLFWLKVHIANCSGVDKVSMEERVKWVDDRRAVISLVHTDPHGAGNIWMASEDPWQALAAMHELSQAWASGDPESFISHVSVPMDGSCNGLQNFSALLRDPVGGKATNLIPQERPADIYAEVAKVVTVRVNADAQAGSLLACKWVDKVTRNMVKQPVMTLPYGASRVGMRDQIQAAVLKHFPGHLDKTEMWAACGYLADVTYDSISTVVVAARQAMDWLQQVARVVAAEGLPVRWTMPAGLPVLQEYTINGSEVMAVHIDGVRRRLFLATDTTELDKRRQAQGISPNLIHSFDAAHLMGTVNRACASGIRNFAMIHDSYGTLAADTDALGAHLRDAFIAQYTPDLLAEFRDELLSQVQEDTAGLIPPLPPMGTLELAALKDSRYFFA